MSRDYRPIIKNASGKLVFKEVEETWNVNIWGAQFWGYLFEKLGAPKKVWQRKGMNSKFETNLSHEINGENFVAVRDILAHALENPEKLDKAIRYAYQKMNETRWPHEKEIQVGVDEMVWPKLTIRDCVFQMFSNPDHIAVASDYCEEFYEKD